MNFGVVARRIGLYDLIEPVRSKRQRARWVAQGKPFPAPPPVKRDLLRRYAADHGLRVLVETGTWRADAVRALRNDFEAIYSIEIDPKLYELCKARCRRQANAHLYLGDSAELIDDILDKLNGPALFWLDAHYMGADSGGEGSNPILAEVQAILKRGVGHVILVDDVREFGADEAYPTIDRVEILAEEHRYAFLVEDDVARLTPPSG
jgi:hypothetical protein